MDDCIQNYYYTKYNILEKSDSITITNTYSSCRGPDDSTIEHLGSKTFYASEIVPFGTSCISEQRVCTDGILSGSYNAINCIVSQVYGNDEYTKLLIHSDSSYLSQEFIDSSNISFAKFGNSSAYFDGTYPDYIQISDSSDWNLANEDFTIETWINLQSLDTTNGEIIITNNDATAAANNYGWDLYYYSNGAGYNEFGFQYSTTGTDLTTLSFSYELLLNQWYHIAISRNGNELKLFLNGNQINSTKDLTGITIKDSTAPLRIGSNYYSTIDSPNSINGYIDELRVSKGIARYTENFTVPTEPYTSDSYNVLLMHFDNGHKNTTFTDSSDSSHTITANGNAIQFSSRPIYENGDVTHYDFYDKKFGTSSAYFDGTGDYLEIADNSDWDFRTEDFTIDFWMKSKQTSPGYYIGLIDFFAFEILMSGNNGLADFWDTTSDLFSTTPISDNIWHHIALVRNSSNVILFIDGKLENSKTWSNDIINSANLKIGNDPDGGTTYYQGYMDELRISKGIARWTTNFTPSLEPYTQDEYTKLLLHFDNDLDSPNFIDSGSSGHQITKVGNTNISNSNSKIGSYSSFDGTGDYLTIPDSIDWNFGLDDFTIEFWTKAIGSGMNHRFIGQGTYSGGFSDYSFDIVTPATGSFKDTLSVAFSNDGTTQNFILRGLINITDQNWHHIAVTRNNNNFYLFIDGNLEEMETQTAFKIYDSTQTLNLGILNTSLNQYLNGYLDELRISKGIARYTSNFVPQTTPFTTDEYTKLLLHFEDFNDSSQRGHDITTYGDTKQSGTHLNNSFAGYFDGDGDYLSIPDSEDFDFGTEDFTIDFWLNNNVNPLTSDTIFSSNINGSPNWSSPENNFILLYTSTTNLRFNHYSSSTWQYLDIPNLNNNWNHIAIVRHNNILSGYLNGKLANTLDITGLIYNSSKFGFGKQDSRDGYYYNGSIEEFRISKGIARWKSDFIPPTEPYESDSYTKLLLHFDPETNYTHFIDSSSSNHQITTYGNTTITRKYPFNGTAIYFDGTGDYLTLPNSEDWDLDGENNQTPYTIDFWFYLNEFSSDGFNSFLWRGDAGTDNSIQLDYDNSANNFRLIYYNSTTPSYFLQRNSKLSLKTWYHFAINYNGENISMYLNGNKLGVSETPSEHIRILNDYDLHIGIRPTALDRNLNGYIDELRISKGIARWNDTFIPPSQPYK